VKFHVSVNDNESTPDALQSVIEDAAAHVDDVDVALLFFTTHHRDQIGPAIEQAWLELDPQALVGCSGEGVIGGQREIERSPGMALLVGKLPPGVRVHPMHISTDEWRHLLGSADDLRERLGLGDETRALIGFGDPWTTPLTQFMHALDELAPKVPLIGGMASGARGAGENVLIRNDQIFDAGFVGLSFSGAIDVQTVVSQGARPIGRSLVITKGHDNVIEQLGGKPAMSTLREMVMELGERDQMLLQHGLLIGQAISEYREKFGRGDFLVRNITGADQESGAFSVADYVRVGQTVQFHVRDAQSADEDLKLMLDAATTSKAGQPAGAVLFSCNGRGTRMFEGPCHDIGVARQIMPATPVAGFFAAGEIGPVGGRNFIHGHTASFALFRPAGQ